MLRNPWAFLMVMFMCVQTLFVPVSALQRGMSSEKNDQFMQFASENSDIRNSLTDEAFYPCRFLLQVQWNEGSIQDSKKNAKLKSFFNIPLRLSVGLAKLLTLGPW